MDLSGFNRALFTKTELIPETGGNQPPAFILLIDLLIRLKLIRFLGLSVSDGLRFTI